jgi:hypothetical protein
MTASGVSGLLLCGLGQLQDSGLSRGFIATEAISTGTYGFSALADLECGGFVAGF